LRPPKGQRNSSNFDLAAKRRREIVFHARYVGAAQTDDFSRWLIAWVWHNRKAKDQVWSVMECAKNMGGKITEAEAAAITDEASITRKHLSADNLARFLGITYQQRQTLGLTTIGSVNVKRRARQEMRKRQNRIAHERRRRQRGMRPWDQSSSRTRPWEAEGMSRRTWERRRNKARDAKVSAPIFLSSEDKLASTERKQSWPSEASPRRKQAEVVRLPTAPTLGADNYAATAGKNNLAQFLVHMSTLPVELRTAALAL
jgi:hypothetical protein